ncbi:MAG: hypothetical protein D6754_08110 [Alphaproteobacteria bacterium]|nr:MAG: hypothetical protein D6754_08110 [Alphaproteobacteria bacterium]
MTRARVLPICPPSALRRAQAAAYCGASAPYFDRMVGEGLLPAPRRLGDGVKVWLRAELDEALAALPADGDGAGGPNPCDRLLG